MKDLRELAEEIVRSVTCFKKKNFDEATLWHVGLIESALLATRREALEEAADIADGYDCTQETHINDACQLSINIGAAIRSLAKK